MAVPNIADPSATVNGSHPRTQIDLGGLTVIANGTITREWFSWGTTSAYGSTIDATPVVQGNFAAWSAVTLMGLSPGTTYHFRARATNASGQGNAADDVTCDTNIGDPSCTTDSYQPDYTSISVDATVTGTGGPNGSITDKGINLYSDVGCTNLVASSGSLGAGSSGFTYNFTGLADGTVYYARAYVTNSVSTQNGGVLVVGTNAYAAPTLGNTSTPWAKSTTTLAPKATYTAENGHAVTACGFVLAEYGTNPTPTIGGAGVTQKAGSPPGVNVEFADTFTGLTGGRVYAVRAYATNATGTTYSAVIQIVTSVISGFAQQQGFGTPTVRSRNTIALTGFAQTQNKPTPVVSSAHLSGKAEVAAFGTPTMHGVNALGLTGFREVAAFGRPFMYRPLQASATLLNTVQGTGTTASFSATGFTATAGSAIIVAVYTAGNQGGTVTITDNKSQTYTKIVLAGSNVALYIAFNVAAGSTTCTVNNLPGGLTSRITCREYGGLTTASDPTDKNATKTDGTSPATGTLSQADELIVVAGWQNTGSGHSAPTAGAGFGNMSGFDDGAQHERGMEDKQVHATTTVTGAITFPGTPFSNFIELIVSFKMKAVAQPQGAVPGGFAQVQGFGVPQVTSRNTLVLTGKAQTQGFGTPTVRSAARLTGKAEVAAFGTPSVTSRNTIALVGKAQQQGFGTPSLHGANTILVDGFGQAQSFGDVTLHGANRITVTGFAQSQAFGTPTLFAYARLTGFAEVAAFGSVAAAGRNVLALVGYPETAAFGTPSLTSANRLILTGHPQPQGFGTPTVHGTNVLVLVGYAQPQGFGQPALTGTNTIPLAGLAQPQGFGTVTMSSANRIVLVGLAETAAFGTPALSSANRIVLVGFAQTQRFGIPVVHGLYPLTAGVHAQLGSGAPLYAAELDSTGRPAATLVDPGRRHARLEQAAGPEAELVDPGPMFTATVQEG